MSVMTCSSWLSLAGQAVASPASFGEATVGKVGGLHPQRGTREDHAKEPPPRIGRGLAGALDDACVCHEQKDEILDDEVRSQ